MTSHSETVTRLREPYRLSSSSTPSKQQQQRQQVNELCHNSPTIVGTRNDTKKTKKVVRFSFVMTEAETSRWRSTDDGDKKNRNNDSIQEEEEETDQLWIPQETFRQWKKDVKQLVHQKEHSRGDCCCFVVVVVVVQIVVVVVVVRRIVAWKCIPCNAKCIAICHESTLYMYTAMQQQDN
jgi:hypothetical protein